MLEYLYSMRAQDEVGNDLKDIRSRGIGSENMGRSRQLLNLQENSKRLAATIKTCG